MLGRAVGVAGFSLYILGHKSSTFVSNTLVLLAISLISGFVTVLKDKAFYTFLSARWAISLMLDSAKRTPKRKPLSISSLLVLCSQTQSDCGLLPNS